MTRVDILVVLLTVPVALSKQLYSKRCHLPSPLIFSQHVEATLDLR